MLVSFVGVVACDEQTAMYLLMRMCYSNIDQILFLD